MIKKELRNIILIIIAWKLLVIVFSNLSQLIFPLQTDFLGGGLLQYLLHLNFWGFINFDGEHYFSIARDGYLPLTYFYFPLYPILIKILAIVFGGSFTAYGISGLILSNAFLFIAMVGLYKLAKMLYSEKSAYLTVIFLLTFPTTFFLGSFYNDSLFLAFAVWSFYFAINKNWLPAIILAGLASATRVVGIALAAGIAIEYLFGELRLNQLLLLKERTCKVVAKGLIVGVLSVSGLLIYMMYLHNKTGSALEFFRNVSIFGEQRSTDLIMLPQVFYRYFFKILPNINYNYFPAVFTPYLEISSAIFAVIILTIMIFRSRISFTVYSILAFLIPAFSGSFSSMPRYLLAIFPIFLLTGKYLDTKSKAFSYTLFALLLLSTLFAVSLFIRGYFVS